MRFNFHTVASLFFKASLDPRSGVLTWQVGMDCAGISFHMDSLLDFWSWKAPKSDTPHVVCMLILGAPHDSNLTKYLVSQFHTRNMTKFEESSKHRKRESGNPIERMKHHWCKQAFWVPILGLSYPCSHLVLTCFHWKTSETLVQASIAWLKKGQKKHWTFHTSRGKSIALITSIIYTGYIMVYHNYIPIFSKLTPKNRWTYNIITGIRYNYTWMWAHSTHCADKAKYLSMIIHVYVICQTF